MKRLFTLALILTSLFTALPSYAIWVCTSTNIKLNQAPWRWEARGYWEAYNNVLRVCRNSPDTNNPGNCHIIQCHWQPFW